MAKGYLKVFVFTAKQTVPIADAKVTLYRDGLTEGNRLTDSSGIAGPFEIEAPPIAESLAPQSVPPYATVDLTVFSPGFRRAEYNGIKIFADREATAYVELIPLPEGRRDSSIIYNLKQPNL